MNLLEQRIITEGRVLGNDILKVDSFLNQQIDTGFLFEICKEFKERYHGCEVTKILTVEASGIAVALATSHVFNDCPVVFAKKGKAANMSGEAYTAKLHSYTRNDDFTVSVTKAYLSKEDKVLILDDFLANGQALQAMISLVQQAGCQLVGCGVIIEKAYQNGGEEVRRTGVRVESLARIRRMSAEEGVEFC